MNRRRLATIAAIALAVALVAGTVFLVRQVFFGPKTITAYFPTATSIYPGDEVRVSGVKVGKIDSIKPEGTQTKMTLRVDRDVPVPADAKAVIVAQNLVAARYVQLTPAYRNGDGPKMGDGGVIPSDRTAVPVEWDEVKTQLMRLSTDLGPQTGVSGTSVSRFIDSAANALGNGNGEKLRETLAQLSGAARIFAEGSGNIVDIVKNLQIFVTALRDSKEQIVLFENRLATLTSVINDSRSDLDGALSNLSVAIGDVQRFVAGSRNQTSEQIARLADLTQILVNNKTSAREHSPHHAERDRQLCQHLLPERRLGHRSILARKLLQPGLLLLRPDRRGREHHRTRNGETLLAIPRSRAAAVQHQQPPVPDQPLLEACHRSGPADLHRPEAGPRGRRAGRPARATADGVGLHRHGRCAAAPRLGQGPAPAAGSVQARTTRPRLLSPALFPGAPIPGPPNIVSNIPAGPTSVDNMLLPQTAPPPADPNAPLLPAEGTPPS